MQNETKLSTRILSLALSAAMVFTTFPQAAFAAEGDAPSQAPSGTVTTTRTITAFGEIAEGVEKSEPFDGHTYVLNVKENTPIEEVKLPTQLSVTVEKTTTNAPAAEPVAEPVAEPAAEPAAEPVAEPAAEPVAEPAAEETPAAEPAAPPVEEPVAPPVEEPKQENLAIIETTQENVSVTWKGDKEYTATENSNVVYTPVLPEGYALKDGAVLPTINVVVGKKAATPTAPTTPVAPTAAMARGTITTRTTALDLETNAEISYIAADGSTSKKANPTTASITDTGEGWAWDHTTKTLTLSGANITNTETATPTTPERPEDLVSYLSYGIILPSGSTIELTENTENYAIGGNIDTSSDLTTGDVLLESAGVCVDAAGGDKAALTIKGKGTLNATGGTLTTGAAVNSRRRSTYSYGITSSDSLNIKGGTVCATGGDVTANSDYPQAASYGISSAYNITVDDAANVTATGGYAEGTFKARGSNNAGFADSYGIDVGEKIVITSSTVNAIGGAATHKDVDSVVEGYPTSTGISNGSSTTINCGTVTAHAVHTGINTTENITINNGSTVVADGTYFGITTQMALSIEDSTVTASGLDESAEMGFGILSPDISIKSGNVIAQGTILAMACMGEDGPGAGRITIADGATVVGSEENGGTTSAAEIGTATAMGMEGIPCLVLTNTKAGAKDVDISFGSSGNTSVSFDPRNGGAITKADIDKVSGTITMPAAPTWGDYTFAGWYTEIDGKGTKFENSNLTASVTVYAKWTKNGKAVYTQPLDLSGATTNLSGDGWEWNNATNTLKLFGITLNSSKLDTDGSAVGILFPNVPCTIILVDGTENTVDVSAAKNSLQSQVIYAENKLTIKTSGKGTPGKLNVIAANANDAINKRDPSIGIYAGGGIDIESGNITAKAGESGNDNSIGISTNGKDIHINGGTVTATGGKSGGTGMAGSFGMYGANVQIDDGTVIATGGEATKSTLSAGIVGYALVKLNGGTINAKGNLAAVAALTNNGLIIDDIGNVKVTPNSATVKTVSMGGLTISTLISDSNVIIVETTIKFKPSYTGTNPFAPDATKVIKTDNSITLPAQTVTGETVEYGVEQGDGTILWQDEPTFSSLNADTEYKFYTRVKANDTHKAGTTSDATTIKTKKAPTSVSVVVKDSGDNILTSDIVVELKQGNNLIKKTDTAISNEYILEGVPEGIYSLVITKGVAPKTVTITETVTVAGIPVNVPDMKFLNGDKNTIVESAPEAPEVAVGGMNDLLNDTHINKTLSNEEKTAVDAGGSVNLKFTADVKTPGAGNTDQSAIEGEAGDQKIDMLLDLSVKKTVTDKDGNPITENEEIHKLESIITVHLAIPAHLQGKDGLTLYRMHNGKPEKLKEGSTSAVDGEYYEVDPSKTFMTVYLKRFSTYAIGYNAFTVTVSDGGTGASGSGKYSSKEVVNINAGSKSGYSFNGWTVIAGDAILANPNSATTSFIMPAEAVTVKANWKNIGGSGEDLPTETYYYITATAGVGGSMSTPERVKVRAGESAGFTITPNKGYQIADVKVNGKSIGAKKNYVFTNIQSDQTIQATFKIGGHGNPLTGVDADEE